MRVPFSEVREQLISQHPPDRGSNKFALWNLDKANEQFGDNWSYRPLSLDEILGIVSSRPLARRLRS